MTSATSQKGFLGFIERAGNKMPHPMLLFIYLILIVMALSAVVSALGISMVNPANGEEIRAFNLLSIEGLLFWAKTFVDNYQAFPVLSIVIIIGIATAVCEKTGFFSSAIKMSLSNVKGSGLVFFISFVSMFGCAIGDASMILIPTLAAAIFYGTGRNPIAGIFCAYAAVGASFGAQLVPGTFDPTLTPLTIAAANIIDPSFDLPLLSGFYLLFLAAIILAVLNTVITVKIIEPKLGAYTGAPEGLEEKDEVTPEERKAVKKAACALAIFLGFIFAASIPSNSFFRGPTGSLVVGAPLMASIRTIIMITFFLPGLVYGVSLKKITSVKDLYNLMVEGMKGLAGFAVLGIIIGQFLALFSKSNLGAILSIAGGGALKAANFPAYAIVIAFFLFVVFVNIFIISGSTKYLIFAPIFVPMFMQLGLHPALVQAVYKLADGMTNALSPLNSMFIVLLALCHKYDKKTGMGTIFSSMLPYSITFTLVFSAVLLAWVFFDLPLGIGGRVYLN